MTNYDSISCFLRRNGQYGENNALSNAYIPNFVAAAGGKDMYKKENGSQRGLAQLNHTVEPQSLFTPKVIPGALWPELMTTGGILQCVI